MLIDWQVTAQYPRSPCDVKLNIHYLSPITLQDVRYDFVYKLLKTQALRPSPVAKYSRILKECVGVMVMNEYGYVLAYEG